ncbi:MAG: DM13 domain-containing protein [Pseudomonadota bacterium]
MTLLKRLAIVTAAGAALFAVAIPALVNAQEAPRAGIFVGDSNHVATGEARLVERDGRWFVELGADFSLDGAPDPKVSVGGLDAGPGLILAPLERKTGAQTYALPVGFDVSSVERIWIWCERFSVPLGHADLSA